MLSVGFSPVGPEFVPDKDVGNGGTTALAGGGGGGLVLEFSCGLILSFGGEGGGGPGGGAGTKCSGDSADINEHCDP